MMKNILLATALILTPHLSLADEQAERASIEELLEVSNVKSMIDAMHDQLGQMLEQMSTQLQVAESEKPIMDKFMSNVDNLIREEVSWEKMEGPIFEIYQKHFSEKEVLDLTAFYQTDSGQAMVRKMPDLMQDSMLVSQGMMGSVLPKVMELAQEFQKEIEENRQ